MAYYYPTFFSYRRRTYIIEKDEQGKDANVLVQSGRTYKKSKVTIERLRRLGKKLN